MIKVGLIGHGQTGQSVAKVLRDDPRFELCWVAKRHAEQPAHSKQTSGPANPSAPIVSLTTALSSSWLDANPVDGLIDFSAPQAIHAYGSIARERGMAIVSAISAYGQDDLTWARELAKDTRVLCSANITMGINFMIVAARLLRLIAPNADVEIVEQHFRDKPEVSGTARKLAASLALDEAHITSLRLGGIVGHHEVIFGFPYQTVRIAHDSIRREAFGTGAAFAMSELMQKPAGFYSFEELLMQRLQDEMLFQAR